MPTPTTFLQLPPSLSLAQSPVVFSVTNAAYQSSSFYYTCTLSIWTGSEANSGSATQYALRKFPNKTGAGIFDVSRFLNSKLTDLAYQVSSSVLNYSCSFNYNYQSGETGSWVNSGIYNAIDGYQVFPEPIGQFPSASTQYWPIMTSGPVSQSVTNNDKGWLSVWKRQSSQVSTVYSGSYSDGSTHVITSAQLFIGSITGSTFGYVARIPTAPSGSGAIGGSFPLPYVTGGAELVSYDIQIKDALLSPTSSARLHFEVDCAYYYTPVRILWKNRYGQFDFFNFYKKHIETFETEQRVYQPQLGTWDSTTLSYNNYQTATQRYIVDSRETLTVNSDFISQDYNDIFKQLLVTDEVYWFYDQPNNLVKPLTIKTNNVTFKTGINDKLVQYTFTFDIGQPFKLII
jgi:hypothetical protein